MRSALALLINQPIATTQTTAAPGGPKALLLKHATVRHPCCTMLGLLCSPSRAVSFVSSSTHPVVPLIWPATLWGIKQGLPGSPGTHTRWCR